MQRSNAGGETNQCGRLRERKPPRSEASGRKHPRYHLNSAQIQLRGTLTPLTRADAGTTQNPSIREPSRRALRADLPHIGRGTFSLRPLSGLPWNAYSCSSQCMFSELYALYTRKPHLSIHRITFCRDNRRPKVLRHCLPRRLLPAEGVSRCSRRRQKPREQP